MPTFTNRIAGITVHENFDLPANSFDIQVPDSSAFTQMGQFDPINISIGFMDVLTRQTWTVGLIVNGIIDSVDFQATPNSRTASARGRDAASLLLDQYFEKLYVSSQGILTTVQAPDGSRYVQFLQQGETQATTIETVPVPTVNVPAHFIPVVQETSARRMAEDICTAAGMTVMWDLRDYVLVETFEATGRIIDILRDVVAPWNITELLKVDIYVQSNTVFLKQRDMLNLVTDYTFTVPSAKIKNLTVTKRIAPLLGRVSLEGKALPTSVTSDNGNVTVIDNETERERVIKTFDASGTVLITVETFLERFRKSDAVLLESTDTLYDMVAKQVAKVEHRVNTWEDPIFRPDGQVNQPLQISTISETKGISATDGVFRLQQRQEILYKFDSNRLLETETTVTSTFDEQTGMTKAEMVVKSLTDFGHNQVQQITTIYKAERTGEIDATNSPLKFVVFSIDTQVNPGQRPGGVQPPASVFVNAGNGGKQAVRLETVLSIDRKAVPFSYSNKYLTLADLQFIMAKLRAINGGFIYEVSWTGLSIPWIRKGNVVQFTQLRDENGVDISLQPILVRSVELNLKQTELVASYTGIFWKAT